MCLYVKLRNFYEKTLKIFLLLVVLLFCVCSSEQLLKAQSEQLQMQVNDLTSSLTNANQLLTKYESNQQENKTYTIGVGGGSNGLGLYASKDKTWMYLDKDTVTIGWQIQF